MFDCYDTDSIIQKSPAHIRSHTYGDIHIDTYTMVPALMRFADKNRYSDRISKSQRSGLIFPVARMIRQLRKIRSAPRVSTTAGVYLAGVLEYLAMETLELAGNASKDNKRKRLTPRDLTLAIRGDEELSTLFNGTISQGGVIPHIHREMVEKKKKKEPDSTKEIKRLKDTIKELQIVYWHHLDLSNGTDAVLTMMKIKPIEERLAELQVNALKNQGFVM